MLTRFRKWLRYRKAKKLAQKFVDQYGYDELVKLFKEMGWL